MDQTQLTIVVVSNNPHSRKLLKETRVDTVYPVDTSFGFSQSNNKAIEESVKLYDSDYYLFINDDAWVETDFFRVLQRIIHEKHPDVVIPLMLKNKSNNIDSFGVEYFTSGYAKNSIFNDVKTTLASAGCVCIKTSFLEKIKQTYGFYFNPILDYYLEDVELSIRASAIGGMFVKERLLVARHQGSVTSGKKSYFSMYHTYRNIIWVIILTWPIPVIVKNLPKILLVHGWTVLYAAWRFGPLMYVRIYFDTILNGKALLEYRKKTLSSYPKSFRFETLFSSYAFRTYKNVTIK